MVERRDPPEIAELVRRLPAESRGALLNRFTAPNLASFLDGFGAAPSGSSW